MSEPDRIPHFGPETTATYWMSRVTNLIQTIRESPMVGYVSSYIAAASVGDRFEDNIDPETGEPLEPGVLVDLLMAAERKAYDEYTGILDKWCDGDEGFTKAARLAEMLAEANYLSLSEIDQDGDADLDYSRECALGYSNLVTSTVDMYRKTQKWSLRNEEGDSV